MNKYFKADIGKRIQDIRQKKNMTQEEFSEKAGIMNAQQVSNIERGVSGISLERFAEICKVLDAFADYLLFGQSFKNQERTIQKYLESMTPDEAKALVEIVEIYAKSCKRDKKIDGR